MAWIEQFQAPDWRLAAAIAAGAYILGCFTTGYYLVRVRLGQDIRLLGSGNVGARNVGRMIGKSGFFLTLFGDLAKGAFAVWAARHFTNDDRLVELAMLAVVLGHIWPAQLRFRGGKGIATSLGALLIYDPHLILAFVMLFLCAFVILRKTVLPGLFAIACLPLASLYADHNHTKTVGIVSLAVIVLLAHSRNLIEEFTLLFERRTAEPKQTPPKL